MAGVSIEAVLRSLTQRQRVEQSDHLPSPFLAVASDLASSEMVVIDHANLASAVHASMAIPAGLEPVELGGRLLVDGGLSCRSEAPVQLRSAGGSQSRLPCTTS